jgi:arylsulfatase A-like enzyme
MVRPSVLSPNTATTRARRYPYYFAQIRCQQTLLDRLFNAMKEAGVWNDAIVIVHGDHGSRILQNLAVNKNAARLTPEDLRDAFSTLFVIRSARQEAAVMREPQPLQRLLSAAFGILMSDSPPKAYLRAGNGTPLKPHILTRFLRDGAQCGKRPAPAEN